MRDPCRASLPVLLLALLVASLAPAVSFGQPDDTHGKVIQVSGDQVVIQLDEPVSMPDTARGRVVAQKGTGMETVAEIRVKSTSGTLVLGRIAEEQSRGAMQTGQRVAFPMLQAGGGGRAATVSLESVPKRATVRLVAEGDTRTVGTTPTTANLPPGSHRLRFRKSGYVPLERVVTVRPDTTLEVRVTLKALDQSVVARKGTLSVRPSPDSATVFVDGEKRGTGRTKVTVSEGTHQVRVTAPGFMPKAESLAVEGGKHRRVAIDLSQEEGTLHVTSTPAQALVSVDGEHVGRTPLTTTQPVGAHTVVARKSGYAAAERSVRVNRAARETLRLALRRPLAVELAVQQDGPVQNPKLAREGDEVRIQYALPSTEASYKVELQLSMNGGTTYQDVPDEVLSGDVGDNVQPGPGKEIRWDALRQYSGGLTGNGNRVRIVAEEAATRNFPGRPGVVLEAVLTPTLTTGTSIGIGDGAFGLRLGYATESVGVFLSGMRVSSGIADVWGIGPRLDVRLTEQGEVWPIGMHTTLDYYFIRSTFSQSTAFESGERLQQEQDGRSHTLDWGYRAYYVLSVGKYFEIIPEIQWTSLTVTRWLQGVETTGLYDLDQQGEGTTVSFGGPLRGGLGVFIGSRSFGVHLKAVGYLNGAGVELLGGIRF